MYKYVHVIIVFLAVIHMAIFFQDTGAAAAGRVQSQHHSLSLESVVLCGGFLEFRAAGVQQRKQLDDMYRARCQ